MSAVTLSVQKEAYDAKYFGLDVPDEVEMVAQERAYTSPIWYAP